MRKNVLFLFFLSIFFSTSLFTAGVAYAQKLSSVGILPIEAARGGIPTDAENLTRQVIEELSSWGTLDILTGDQANNAEYVVKSLLSRQGNLLILTASTTETRTGKMLNESREQAPNASGISVFIFCTKIVENVPYPNYLLGKWQSVISMSDSQVACIMEFKSNRTVQVEQYETWEHRQDNVLKYEGFGSGTYGYAGYMRRTMTIQNRQIQVDATVSITLQIEEALTEYTTVSQGGLRLLFSDDRNSFEIVSGGLPCGRNYDGASVYPSERLFFTRFTKI
jgi:hypothetical protein